jgi:type I restriction enzyme S subunit
MKINVEKYPAYKDSGVTWLGEIPSHWTIKRIKHLFAEINERSFDGSEDLLSVSQYTGVTNKTERLEDGGMLTNAATLEGYKKVWEGDLVSNIMLAWNGSLGFSPFNGITSPAYSIYRLKTNDVNRYFHYLLRTELYKAEFKRNSSGVIESRLRLYTDDFFRIESILPPLPEQTAIAAFLDRKTALIDQAIDIKQKQIELLKERRQILIHKAVTRGVTSSGVEMPNVKMKDSGVEWIGEIPEHWEVKKVKHFGVIRSGESVVNSLLNDSGQYEVYGGNGNMGFYNKFNVEGYKIIIGRVGAYCGNVRLINEKKWISDNALILTLNNEDIYSFIAILLEVGNLNNLNSSNAQPLITGSKVLNFQLPIPSINEQSEIQLFIKNIKHKNATAISLKEQEIEKLKEYKATLINSAVTGKIMVNG